MDINSIQINLEVRQIISTELAWEDKLIPFEIKNNILKLYVSEDADQEQIKTKLFIITGKQIELDVISYSLVNKLLNKYYPQKNNSKVSYVNNVNDDSFIESLILESKELGSSDIHIEPYENKSIVRIRIDGKLIERYNITKSAYPAIINKIKILSNLDISEKRLPQDGRISISTLNNKFDIRVSVLPILHGEKIVLRILNNDTANLNIHKLGMNSLCKKYYLENIYKPHGIILISGPTGSGKTTTLYATLKELNQSTTNILTIEDPIEYTLEGINQVQLKEEIGLDFTKAMRTFLRQDPDIIMVGEIRDVETAQMAIRAALTGHIVFSTIHTNSAWGIIARLVDMGIPPYLVMNTLNLAVAQRLVRLLCPNCKQKKTFDNELLPESFKVKTKINYHYIASGCNNCFHTGYKGRKAIYEMIPVVEKLKEEYNCTNFSINKYYIENKIDLLAQNAFELVIKGKTSIEEIYPILYQS